MHVTETCDEGNPRVITNVQTPIAPQTSVETTEPIHEVLSAKARLPSQHLVDSGYVSAELLVSSPNDYQIELVGPVRTKGHWQVKADQG